MTTRILIAVTNTDRFATRPTHRTGLWLSELTHATDVFEERGFEYTLISPAGGRSPLEPRSLRFPLMDASARRWHRDPWRMARLESTLAADEVDSAGYDGIYFTGGHGVMFDFPSSTGLQRLTGEIADRGGAVGAICHGYCGLLETTRPDGSPLLAGRRITGFSWNEEILAGISRIAPYDVEQRAKDLGADYSKAALPFVSNTVADGRLVTGQNPASARATAERFATLF
ncbi:type 1 glutamine amidotransferase domain-containing protein [Leucobacter sp. CSA2]|uniref:Type 1 glutamine amidotransferase domain-containing protein n=1 Tax=Leucobacter edaphi TaxID=2796472 RepID=A0A934UVF7_9MICO|nr:type 1 glutamine amidotransferase domain-containing protein [Leucobacter edaphi]MBK0420529.1 type 1 glutamine amidotransferase domain-containing protein [Leucobacter edaphi]